MDYQALGRSGLVVSRVGLGCLNFGSRMDVEASRAVVDAAIDLGVTLLDTADIYGPDGASELILGEVLAGRRDQVILATKFGHPGIDMGFGPAAGAKGGRAYVRRAVEASLRRLRTDYIDLYQIHMPDHATPILETLAALHELVLEGKVRYVGHSNFAGWQLAQAHHLAYENGLTPFISAQNNWSLLARQVENDVVPAAEHYGVGVLPYYPLAEGMLTGKVRRGAPLPDGSRISSRSHLVTAENLDRVDRLTRWGQENGRSLLEIAVGWLAAQPCVGSVIAGASTPGQLQANVQAAGWIPTPSDLQSIDRILSAP